MDQDASSAIFPDKTAMATHTWLLQEQQRWADRVGEPLFVTIRLVYDGTIEVDVETFTGQHGMAGGESLSQSLTAAVELLLSLRQTAAGSL